MTRKLVATGNSLALTLDKTMRDHLGITTIVEVQLREGEIVLRKPMTIQEAAENTKQRYGRALKKLAE